MQKSPTHHEFAKMTKRNGGKGFREDVCPVEIRCHFFDGDDAGRNLVPEMVPFDRNVSSALGLTVGRVCELNCCRVVFPDDGTLELG